MFKSIPKDVRGRASAGARHLDRVRPGWRSQINPVTLDIGDGSRCVVAQLTGNFGSLDKVGVTAANWQKLGFMPGTAGREFDKDANLLTHAWRGEIRQHVPRWSLRRLWSKLPV